MLAIRAYAFTIFTVPNETLKPALKEGDRVVVNRLSRAHFNVGDVVLVDRTRQILGRIIAVPGDTITIKGDKYLIPKICHEKCQCACCHYYLLGVGNRQVLVQQGDIIGRAYLLFRWKR